DMRGERGVGKLAFAGAEPGKIEAQHRNAVQLHPFRNMPRRPIALAAGEAMRKQRHRTDRAIRPVEQRREGVALGVAEVEFLGGHGQLLRRLAFHVWIFPPRSQSRTRQYSVRNTSWKFEPNPSPMVAAAMYAENG